MGGEEIIGYLWIANPTCKNNRLIISKYAKLLQLNNAILRKIKKKNLIIIKNCSQYMLKISVLTTFSNNLLSYSGNFEKLGK